VVNPPQTIIWRPVHMATGSARPRSGEAGRPDRYIDAVVKVADSGE